MKARNILFVTGNKRKVWQAQSVLQPLGIQVESKDLDIVEIQAHDPLDIAIAKAQAAYAQVGQPLVICDHAWSFHALKGFPGGYMKDVNGWFEADDFLALMSGKSDRLVTLTETVVYVDGNVVEHFSVDFPGTVTKEARGTGDVVCERVVVYDGSDKTIAEHVDAGEHARDMSKSAWYKFGEWYNGI